MISILILAATQNHSFCQNRKSNSNLIYKMGNKYKENTTEKKYWIAATEVIGINTIVLFKARYIDNENWSKISINSIKNNFNNGFAWDDNAFGMNQFFHPYHGSAYFNAARSNGLSFWESAPYTFGGSLMWEMAMEVELPSYNDLINTTVSGIILGEITYRFSDQIIDEQSVGFERFTREFTTLIINPVRGFNRLIRGQMWKVGQVKKKRMITARLSMGFNNLFINQKISNNYGYLFIGLDIDYGDKFSTSTHRKPFDFIRIHSELNLANGDDIIGISASGVLWDWKFYSRNIAGFYKEFDYFENYIYKFTATSLTFEINNNTNLLTNFRLQNSFGISGIFLGGTNSVYSNEVSMEYNLGPGLGARIIMNAELSKRMELSFIVKQFWIYIVNGINGNEFIGLFNTKLMYKINQNNSIGLSLVLYERVGIYADYHDEHIENVSARIFAQIYL